MEFLFQYLLVPLLSFFSGGAITVYLAHWLSVRQRRYDRKFDVLLQIKRDVNALYSEEQNSLTNLCHSLDDATLIFSSEKIRLAIATFLSQKGDAYSFDEINNIMNLMCYDIDRKLEWKKGSIN